MASNDQNILKLLLEQSRAEIAPNASAEDYFELFCAEQILKNFDLTYEELQAGVVDGEHDGGIDSAYCFVNGELVHEDCDFSYLKKNVQIELHIIQSKTSAGFSEASIDSLTSSTRHLLSLDANYEDYPQYNTLLKTTLDGFRQAYGALVLRFPNLTIHYHYASKVAGVHVHENLWRKAQDLKDTASELFAGAEVEFNFIGARKLLELARRQPRTTHELRVVKNLSDVDGYIVLIRLDEYARFLRDTTGGFRAELFESNVRDFQGNTEVNADIDNTLRTEKEIDFWWMNNGVTILASKATLTGDTVAIASPQIVNGLQTSTQIEKYSSKGTEDSRKLMVKIVSSENEEIRDKIIKATNRQNPIQSATLRATDKIQRDIETALKSVGLFYDRRKNHYKNQGKPLDRIISIPLMAQALMSVILGRPDEARARPSSLIKKDEDYAKLFSENMPIGVYAKTAQLIGRIDSVLKKRATEARDRSNIRFYVLYWVASMLTGTPRPSRKEILKLDVGALEDQCIESAVDDVLELYKGLGSNDQVAKGSDLRAAVAKEVEGRLQDGVAQ